MMESDKKRKNWPNDEAGSSSQALPEEPSQLEDHIANVVCQA